MKVPPDLIPGLKWGSHQPALVSAVVLATRHSKSPVLEVGMGHFSTPLLHALTGAVGVDLYSVEADKDWASQFLHYAGPHHSILGCEYDELFLKIDPLAFSVAFLDNSPGDHRAELFERLLPMAQYLVVHDYWEEIRELIEAKNLSYYHVIAERYEPPTLVASFYHVPDSTLL